MQQTPAHKDTPHLSFAHRCPLSQAVLASRQGDDGATRTLYRGLLRELPPMVMAEARRFGIWLSALEREELVQELLIDIWENDLHRYEPERGSLLTFVHTKVRWRVADWGRSQARWRDQIDSLEDRQEAGLPEPLTDLRPDTLIERAYNDLQLLAFDQAVQHTLPKLRDNERQAIETCDLEEKPLRTLACTLGVHPSNACRARQRGLDALRRELPITVRPPNAHTRAARRRAQIRAQGERGQRGGSAFWASL